MGEPIAPKQHKLKQRFVGAVVAEGKRVLIWGSELVSFGVRVMPSGVKSYVIPYRIGQGSLARERWTSRQKHASDVIRRRRDAATRSVFFIGFFLLYLVSARTAHRVVGYFEEEARISYTMYLQEIDEGRSTNVPAPAIAKHYWQLPADATRRDVVLVVQADEAHHRDINHGFASKLAGKPVNEAATAPCPPHADDIRMTP